MFLTSHRLQGSGRNVAFGKAQTSGPRVVSTAAYHATDSCRSSRKRPPRGWRDWPVWRYSAKESQSPRDPPFLLGVGLCSEPSATGIPLSLPLGTSPSGKKKGSENTTLAEMNMEMQDYVTTQTARTDIVLFFCWFAVKLQLTYGNPGFPWWPNKGQLAQLLSSDKIRLSWAIQVRAPKNSDRVFIQHSTLKEPFMHWFIKVTSHCAT